MKTVMKAAISSMALAIVLSGGTVVDARDAVQEIPLTQPPEMVLEDGIKGVQTDLYVMADRSDNEIRMSYADSRTQAEDSRMSPSTEDLRTSLWEPWEGVSTWDMIEDSAG